MENDALTVHDYWQEPGRYETVNGWWRARGMGTFPETRIPKLAVIVKRGGVAVAFLCCYLYLDIGIARLDWMVTAPEQTAAQSAAAMLFAETALCAAAKVNGYSEMHTSTIPVAARFLRRRAGWVENGERIELVKEL